MSNLYDKKTKVDPPEGYTWQTAFNNMTLCDGKKLHHKWQIIHCGFMYERSVTEEEYNDDRFAEEWKLALCAEVNGQHVPEVVHNEKGN